MHEQSAHSAFSALQRDLPTTIIGRTLLHYEQVASTNDLARDFARSGRAEGLVILAEEQTRGRGRMGRGWAAPPGSSLLLTLLLRPTWLPPADAFTLTMLAGVALCEAVEQVADLSAALKWPNDLMLPGSLGVAAERRKAAGILSELEVAGDAIVWAAIGMGINVNWTPRGIVDDRDLERNATSLSAVAGRAIDRLALLRALLTRLDARYLALRHGHREELFHAWRGRLATLGQEVRVRTPRGDLEGLAQEVDRSGALQIRDANGNLHTITAGDVSS